MPETGSLQLFLQAAETIGWPAEDAAERNRLEALYLEYTRLCENNNPVMPLSVAWNDEDEDTEDADRTFTELKKWPGEEEEHKDQPNGAAEYYLALREVKTVAKRILGELEELITARNAGTPEERKLLDSLHGVAMLDRNSAPRDADAALSALETAAYQCMVEKKGLFGIKNNTAQKVRELAKEGWALAGQAQMDLDLSALPPGDPKSRIDPALPLIGQMEQVPETAPVAGASGRLQRLVRFDDLQAELRSQHPGRTPRNS